MVRRVGSVIDEESRGHRVPAFHSWWKATAQDPLFLFIADIRSAEFKRAEDTKRAEHNIQVSDTVTSSSLTLAHIRDGQVIEERSYSEPPAPPPVTPGPTHTVAWYFVGGSRDGQEVLGVLR
jgi:hypothetical protein